MSDDFITHLNASRFMAQRSIFAATVEVTPPDSYALPGALAPIAADRLEAHQDDGLEMREIVDYENTHFLATNVRARERHAQWVNRDYNAMVQAHQEIEAERRANEMRASAQYQARLERILAAKDAQD